MRAWPPKRIVVAVDFGEASGRACRVASTLARTLGANITLVHAERFDAPPYFTHEQLGSLEAEWQLARRGAEGHVRAFAAEHGLADADVVISDLPAVDAILHAADGADLLILGAHGRRGPSRWWLGSASERVVRSSPSPALVVHAQDAQAHGTDLLARVLVLRHGHGPAEAAGAARDLAAPAGGVVTIDETSADGCEPRGLETATLVVVPLAHSPRARTMHEVADALSGRCMVPVLFVPAGSTSDIDTTGATRVTV